MTEKIAVILGGTGMVGANMAQLLDEEGGWDVTIVSRRSPDFEPGMPPTFDLCSKVQR